MIGLRYDQKMWEWLSLIIASQSGTGMSWPQLQCLSQWKLIVLTRLKKMCWWCGRVWGCMMYCDSCGVCGVMVTTAHLIMITQVETLVTGHTDHVNLDQHTLQEPRIPICLWPGEREHQLDQKQSTFIIWHHETQSYTHGDNDSTRPWDNDFNESSFGCFRALIKSC